MVDIALDKNQRLWISSGEAMLIFGPQHATFSTFEKDFINKSSFNGGFPNSVYRDDSGTWWIGVFPSGMNYVDSSKSEFFTYQYDPQDINTLSHNSVLFITEDDNGNLWVGTDGGEVNCQSSLGQGSTFCLSLPLKTPKSSSNEGITSS